MDSGPCPEGEPADPGVAPRERSRARTTPPAAPPRQRAHLAPAVELDHETGSGALVRGQVQRRQLALVQLAVQRKVIEAPAVGVQRSGVQGFRVRASGFQGAAPAFAARSDRGSSGRWPAWSEYWGCCVPRPRGWAASPSIARDGAHPRCRPHSQLLPRWPARWRPQAATGRVWMHQACMHDDGQPRRSHQTLLCIAEGRCLVTHIVRCSDAAGSPAAQKTDGSLDDGSGPTAPPAVARCATDVHLEASLP